MRSLLIATLCLIMCTSVKAQTQALGTILGNQAVIPIATAPTGYAVSGQALIYYPDDYFLAKNANKRYPLFMFLHGAGEGASTNISELLNTSLPQLIAQGLKPYGIDTVTGDTVKFIVVSPHCAQCGGSYSYPQLQYTLPYLISNYRIDTTCIWVGGLSSGGRGTFSMPMGNVVGDTLWSKKLAGIMPMANGGYDNRTDLFPNLITAMKSGMAVLYTIGDQDPGYNAAGYFQYDAVMSKNALPGKYYTKVIIGGTHSAGVWNPPFALASRLWNAKYNAWTQMANTRRVFSDVKTVLSANAGADQTITLPASTVTLAGSAVPATGTTISSYAWSLVSGPNTPTIATPAAASSAISGLVAGSYTFRLTVANSAGSKATDDVVVTVNPAANKVPTANAGADQTIQLPTSTVTLGGSGADSDGTISSYAWTKVSGGTATITSTASASTTVTGLVAGTYLFSLAVTDNSGAKALDTVRIIVNAAANKAPTANAGADQTIQLPTSTVTLGGSGADSDGTISSYAWTKVSGGTATITSAASASTTVTGLVAGTYLFGLTVTDNGGAKAVDTVQVTVNAAQNPNSGSGTLPTGNNQSTISIPVNAPGYATSSALVYYPDDYNLAANANKRYALFIFLHAEAQGVSSDINELTTASLPMLISQGLKPYGIDSLTGDTVKFIVVSPHAANSYGSYSYAQLKYTIPYLISNLRVDTTCIWLGGPSMGGRGTFSVPMEDTTLGKRLAGIMPMSDGGYDNRVDLIPKLNLCLKRGVGYIYTCGALDEGVLGNSRYYQDTMRRSVNTGRGFYKEIAALGHVADAWTQPFYLTSRWWNTNKNAWDIMANTRRAVSKTGASTTAAAAQMTAASFSADPTSGAPALSLYPNPVRDAFVLGLNNRYTGKMLIQVIDGSGAVRKAYSYTKDQPFIQLSVTVGDLPTGTYFVRIQVGGYSETKKIVKL